MRTLLFSLFLIILVSCDLIASTQLELAVVKALKADPRTASSSFEVSHQGDGEVWITGEVAGDTERAAVTEVAQAVEGVTNVINRCKVPETGGGLMQDTVLVTPYF